MVVFRNKLSVDKFLMPFLSQLILELFSPQPINLWNFNFVRFRFFISSVTRTHLLQIGGEKDGVWNYFSKR